ncbi:anthranilate phosphoribosyltransferase [Streptomyces sp. M1013]|uniref:anthranilate phosphoribosyltransferase n=1 Tax=Streptomyces sp. M1013 TaxID=549798 RepID=UPI000978EC7E|nr:anthranilate phosphoribosyltransferase [Streptomyces sp. M1013]OMI84865.1 anthranilate phosphoribosyltransferase [Streptomyces sp. M1013]
MTRSAHEPGWPALLTTLLDRCDLSADDTAWAMDETMSGTVTPVRMAAFLIALRAKGETVEEVGGLVRSLTAHAHTVDVPGPTLDIVGTGGDGAHTVNVSTMAAVVAAGAGARVVKHGNRSASSACGSADVLEELGIPLGLPGHHAAETVARAGITFCFAPLFHPSMRHASAVRRELGVPTVFNVLGPLSNPAAPTAQAVGVADRRTAPLIAGVLAARGTRALVFRGDDGLDELTVTTTSTVWSVQDGEVHESRFDPLDIGVPRAPLDALRGGDRVHNARVARRVLNGEPGPVRNAVLLSAAAGLAALEPGAGTVTERLAAGWERAAEAVDSGRAAQVLDDWITVTAKLAAAG